ncbi:MAG: acyclic terpene utilization AtuA family protein, partial [Solirubrobacterales bacterium]
GEIAERGIRVVTNAGGLNSPALARALEAAIAEAGLELKVAYVQGDDLAMRVDEVRASGATDMVTGEALPEQVRTMNAYIGALPVAAALDEGADIVVTGRCADSAAMLGPLIHEFDWKDDDYDLLSAGSLIGHLLECGAQGVGGLFTDWADVPGWDNIGYPVAECHPDGSAVITKPEGTGGLAIPGSVGEQMLYEIGDPGRYLLPDVTCDWRDVTLTQEGPDRVLVQGAKGSEPTSSYKATVTAPDGWRVVTTALLTGHQAGGRARRAAEAAVARSERLMAEEGIEPFPEKSIEIVGTGDAVARPAENDETREAVLKIGLRHPDRRAMEIFGKEFVSIAFVAQGVTGVFGGRPKAAPVIRLYHVLIPKGEVAVTVTMAGETREVAIPPGTDSPATGAEPLSEELVEPEGETLTVPLVRLGWARRGAKGTPADI